MKVIGVTGAVAAQLARGADEFGGERAEAGAECKRLPACDVRADFGRDAREIEAAFLPVTIQIGKRNALQHLPRERHVAPRGVDVEHGGHGHAEASDGAQHLRLDFHVIVTIGAIFDADECVTSADRCCKRDMVALTDAGTQRDAFAEVAGDDPGERGGEFVRRKSRRATTQAVERGGAVALPVVDVRARMRECGVHAGESLAMGATGALADSAAGDDSAGGRARQ